MAKKIDPNDCPKCLPGWLAAFGDLMSLLLCFFVLLLSMSTMDPKKFDTAVGSLAGALSVLEGGARPESQDEKETELESKIKKVKVKAQSDNEITQAVKAINELLTANGSPQVVLKESEDGFVVRLPATLLFDQSSARIQNDDAKLFIKRISMIAQKLPSDVDIDVVGHTDKTLPDINSGFENNWQLSTARAISVVDELMADGVSPKKLIASGRASYEPIATNDSEDGRIKNNRVEIRFFSFDSKKMNDTKKSILDAK